MIIIISDKTMDYIKCLFFPIDTNHLYHTYIGNIFKIIRGEQITNIYFKTNTVVKFNIWTKDLPENLEEENHVLIHYQEITNNITYFNIKTINIIPNLNHIYHSPTVYCLDCGYKLSIDNLKKCQGNIIRYCEWDDMLLEDVYKDNRCNICYHNAYTIGAKCKIENVACPNCWSIRSMKR